MSDPTGQGHPESGDAPTVTSGQDAGGQEQISTWDYQGNGQALQVSVCGCRAVDLSSHEGVLSRWRQLKDETLRIIPHLPIDEVQARRAWALYESRRARKEVDAEREFAGRMGLLLRGYVDFPADNSAAFSNLRLVSTIAASTPGLVVPTLNGSFTAGLRRMLEDLALLDPATRNALIFGGRVPGRGRS